MTVATRVDYLGDVTAITARPSPIPGHTTVTIGLSDRLLPAVFQLDDDARRHLVAALTGDTIPTPALACA